MNIVSISKKGQGLTEYLILVALIALVSFAIVQSIGTDVEGTFQATKGKTGQLKAAATK